MSALPEAVPALMHPSDAPSHSCIVFFIRTWAVAGHIPHGYPYKRSIKLSHLNCMN
jgi:hypothetical protein